MLAEENVMEILDDRALYPLLGRAVPVLGAK